MTHIVQSNDSTVSLTGGRSLTPLADVNSTITGLPQTGRLDDLQQTNKHYYHLYLHLTGNKCVYKGLCLTGNDELWIYTQVNLYSMLKMKTS